MFRYSSRTTFFYKHLNRMRTKHFLFIERVLQDVTLVAKNIKLETSGCITFGTPYTYVQGVLYLCTGCFVPMYRVFCTYVQGVLYLRTGCFVPMYRVFCTYVQVFCTMYKVFCTFVQGVFKLIIRMTIWFFS